MTNTRFEYKRTTCPESPDQAHVWMHLGPVKDVDFGWEFMWACKYCRRVESEERDSVDTGPLCVGN